MMLKVAGISAVLGLCTASSIAQQIPSEKLPTRVFSVSDRNSDVDSRPHPLFDRVKLLISAAQLEDGTQFRSFFKPGPGPSLVGKQLMATPELFQVLKKSCDDPILYDEGRDWVQFAWACYSGPPLSDIVIQKKGEVSATLWFDGDLIRGYSIGEPLDVPGMRFYSLIPRPANQTVK